MQEVDEIQINFSQLNIFFETSSLGLVESGHALGVQVERCEALLSSKESRAEKWRGLLEGSEELVTLERVRKSAQSLERNLEPLEPSHQLFIDHQERCCAALNRLRSALSPSLELAQASIMLYEERLKSLAEELSELLVTKDTELNTLSDEIREGVERLSTGWLKMEARLEGIALEMQENLEALKVAGEALFAQLSEARRALIIQGFEAFTQEVQGSFRDFETAALEISALLGHSAEEIVLNVQEHLAVELTEIFDDLFAEVTGRAISTLAAELMECLAVAGLSSSVMLLLAPLLPELVAARWLIHSIRSLTELL